LSHAIQREPNSTANVKLMTAASAARSVIFYSAAAATTENKSSNQISMAFEAS